MDELYIFAEQIYIVKNLGCLKFKSKNKSNRRTSLPSVKKLKKNKKQSNILVNSSKLGAENTNSGAGYKRTLDKEQKNLKDLFKDSELEQKQEKKIHRIRMARIKLLAYLTLTSTLNKEKESKFSLVEGKYLKIVINKDKPYVSTSADEVLVEKIE
jgi:hypothetical protein